MSNHVYEIVTYSVSDTALAEQAREALLPVLASYPGFVRWTRFVSANDDKRFIDQVEWDSLEHSLAAAERFLADPATQPLMALTDEVLAMCHVKHVS